MQHPENNKIVARPEKSYDRRSPEIPSVTKHQSIQRSTVMALYFYVHRIDRHTKVYLLITKRRNQDETIKLHNLIHFCQRIDGMSVVIGYAIHERRLQIIQSLRKAFHDMP